MLSKRTLIPLVIFVASLAIYGLFPTHNWYYADDSLTWAVAMREGSGLIHHHHLYLNAMRWIYHHVTSPLGIFQDPRFFLCSYAALTGAIGLVFLYKLLRCLHCGRWALPGTILCGVTAGYWSYAIVGDVYVPAIAFMVAGLYFTCRAFTTRRLSPYVLRYLAAIVCYILMLAHHQAFAFLVIGLCPSILLLRRVPLGRRLGGAFGIPLATGLSVLGIYGLIYLAQPPVERAGFGSFVAGYVSHFRTVPDMKQLSLGSMVNACAGLTRAALSTSFLFRSQSFAETVQNRFPYRHVYPSIYLVHSLSRPVVFATVGCFLFSLLTLFVLGVRGIWQVLKSRRLSALVLIAAVPQSLFFLWWEGISDEFWLWSTPIVALAVVFGARAMYRPGRWLLLAVTATVAFSTFSGTIYPLLRDSNDIDWLNEGFVAQLSAKDLAITMNEFSVSGRIELARQQQGFRFLSISGESLHSRPFDFDKLHAHIEQTLAQGGDIYIDPYVEVTPKSYLRMLQLHNQRFKQDWPQIRAVLHNIDPARVHWVPITATVPGFFEKQPPVKND